MVLELDNCAFCEGQKGGVRGNENVLPNGVVICDYCTALLHGTAAFTPLQAQKEPGFEGEDGG